MKKFVIETSPPLQGVIKVSGAKNSVLKILAASLLAEGECIIEDVPNLLDVHVMIEILRELGSEVHYYEEENRITTKVIDPEKYQVNYELTNKMRASIIVMGALLARCNRAEVALPGGCAIGSRPIDLHIKGFKALGVDVKMGHGSVSGTVQKRMKGNNIYLDFPSVGATENIMMAAVKAEGTTVIENAAQEPEITDLASFLVKMGADIYGAGTSTIRIKGVDKLNGVRHQVIPDRIEAGTYMVATAITKGKVLIKNVLATHQRPVISKLQEAGVYLDIKDEEILVDATNGFHGVDVTTLPYPGFPTDMQAQFMVLLTLCKGMHVVKETIFENRFMHVNELMRMGANIKLDGSSAMVQGVEELEGAEVRATDLRAGSALIIAGLVANGRTVVYEPDHINRGFVSIEKKLSQVGGRIWTE
ncbi:UDP-N-acetylglucosamine 1-carboxyvinyltransferase [Guggenheimella bovis]